MRLLPSKREFTIADTGLDSVEKVALGGIEQSILIQAEDPTKPILLFIHGGPCMPVPGVVSRGQDYAVATTTKELVKHFVLVFWDQRGSGKSFDKKVSPESMRVERFISDCNELIDILCKRFHQEKLFIAGHSWGTVIGLSIASRFPEKLYGYFGISQLLNWAENDRLCYEWVKIKAEKTNDKKTLSKLGLLGPPPYIKGVKQWIDFRQLLIIKHNSMIYENESIKHPGVISAFKLFLSSSDYSLKNIFHTFYSAYKLTYTQALITDFAEINLDSIKRLDIPVFFLHGKKDMHVNGKPVEKFVENLDAPFGKEMVWYDNSSHMFHPEDAREIERFMISTALKIIY